MRMSVISSAVDTYLTTKSSRAILSHHVFGVGVENKTSREISCSNVVAPHRKSNKMVSPVCAVQLTRTVSVNR